MQAFAQRFTIAAFAWAWLWLVWGSTSEGKQTYLRMAGLLWEEDNGKGVLPIITLAAPILGAAAVIQLCGLTRSRSRSTARCAGDPFFDAYALAMILFPLSCYVAFSLFGERLSRSSGSSDERLTKIANTFGVASLISFCFLFVPVARHSSFLKTFGWSPSAAIRLHIWSGRLVVVAALAHGSVHLLRYRRRGASLASALIPPAECFTRMFWSHHNEEATRFCANEHSECSCNDLWRNLFGALGAVFLLVLALSSLSFVRRRFYALFYRIHVVAGPLVVVCAVLHWNRSILYLAGGLVYYITSSLALLLEQQLATRNLSSTKIVEVEHLPSVSIRNRRQVVAITFDATESAVTEFRPGYYVNLRAPDISLISHPFTINRVPHHPRRLRVLFREQGPFTKRLARELQPKSVAQLSRNSRVGPRILLDGYHGADRLQSGLCHDRLVIVAGGIGITPYLSLLHDIATSAVDKGRPRVAVLHWVCRDESLIAYVEREYFTHLAVEPAIVSSHEIHIIVHTTGKVASPFPSYTNLELARDDSGDRLYRQGDSDCQSACREIPFCQATLSSLCCKQSWVHHIWHCFSFSLSSALSITCIWVVYATIQKNELKNVFLRLLYLAVLVLVSLMGALVSLRLALGRSDSSCGSSEAEERNLEMGRVHCPGSQEARRQTCDCSAKGTVSVRRSPGRPSMEEIVRELLAAECDRPGLMVCGPPALVADARTHLRSHPLGACVAVYEENFTL